MYIFRPGRFFLKKRIKEVAHHIQGDTLDIGAGEIDRYGSYFNTDGKPVSRTDVN
jgi:hypothetical protein